jgi:hypothetical protein
MSAQNVLVALSFTAAFAYLTARLVALIWGVPRMAPRLRALLELRKELPRITSPARSLDVWVLLVILVIVELVLMRMLAGAVSSGDTPATAMLICHFLFAVSWVLYLSRVSPA